MEDLIGSYSIQMANGKWSAAYSDTRYKPIATLHTEEMVIKEMLYILIVSVLENEF